MPKGTRGRAHCSVAACHRIAHGGGLCEFHYLRRRRGIELEAPPMKTGSPDDPCSVSRCSEPIGRHGARGWCAAHYKRWAAYGDPCGKPFRPTLAERLWRNIERPADTTCWLWTASLSGRGYGVIGAVTGSRLAHRVMYEFIVGPIPEGLVLDHLCCVKRCVNPSHLEPVTSFENLARHWRKVLAA